MSLSGFTIAKPLFKLAIRPTSGLLALLSGARQRRHLARLDDHLLRDIGLSRAEASAEASRMIWDAPAHWTRGGGERD